MIRRLFWFVSGAVAGVTGMAWVKRRATEMREAITFETVIRSLRDLAVYSFRRAGIGLSWLRGYVTGEDSPGVVQDPPVESRPARRHIASRPHNSHR